MNYFLQKILQWFPRLRAMAQSPPPSLAADLDQARAQFMQAYNNQNYATLCDVLHEQATFRGSVYPERWTFTRDRIITDRYMSYETCTAIKAGATAVPGEGTRSVGSMTLGLSPTTVTPIGDNYAVDT